MGVVSNNKLLLSVVSSRLECSNKASYSVTKNGSAINGYSLLNTNFCPKIFATKYLPSIKSNFKISSNVYLSFLGNPKLIDLPSIS